MCKKFQATVSGIEDTWIFSFELNKLIFILEVSVFHDKIKSQLIQF